VESTGRGLYRELYLSPNETYGIVKTHDGLNVYFHPDVFDYAFYGRSQWEISTVKDVIDRGRVERIKWIKEFISGNVSNSQCWAIPVSKTALKRLYLSVNPGYVVWINPRADKQSFNFRNAYPADPPRVWEYARSVKDSKLIARF